MPAFATHEIFGEEALEEGIQPEYMTVVKKHMNVFHTGCQGPDIFFFNPFMLKGKKEFNLGHRLHETKVNAFFEIYLEEMAQLRHRSALEIGITYFLGFLAHYTLDSEVHPYVFAKTGYNPEEEDSAARTISAHHRLEALMDKQMLMIKRNQLPSAFFPEKEIYLTSQELDVIAVLMSRTISRLFHLKVTVANIKASYTCMYASMKYIYQHGGHKKEHIQAFEHHVLHQPVFANMIVNDYLVDKVDAMNYSGMEWESPWEPGRKQELSVWELYDNALERYQQYGEALEPILGGMLQRMVLLENHRSRAESALSALKEQIPLAAQVLENKSYHTGRSLV